MANDDAVVPTAPPVAATGVNMNRNISTTRSVALMDVPQPACMWHKACFNARQQTEPTTTLCSPHNTNKAVMTPTTARPEHISHAATPQTGSPLCCCPPWHCPGAAVLLAEVLLLSPKMLVEAAAGPGPGTGTGTGSDSRLSVRNNCRRSISRAGSDSGTCARKHTRVHTCVSAHAPR